MNISEVMATNVVTLDATSTAVEAARMMKERDIGDVVVREADRVCGIVTDRDIVAGRRRGQEPAERQVGRHLQPRPRHARPDRLRQRCGAGHERAGRGGSLVVENGKVVGIVSLGDLAIERDPVSRPSPTSARRRRTTD